MNPKVSKSSFFNLPSMDKFPDINQSLKMINTINAFPQHSSFDNMELAVVGTGTGDPAVESGQDSLGQRISHVATASKKKRTGCTCKKTFCLKMYCQCFSQGRECGEDCGCIGCKNTAEFRQEVVAAKTAVKEGGLRNCSLSEKRCNCKKSGCLKRYCECYNSGVGCSQACKCQGCKNTSRPHPIEESPSPYEEKAQQKLHVGHEFLLMKKCGSVDDFQKYYD